LGQSANVLVLVAAAAAVVVVVVVVRRPCCAITCLVVACRVERWTDWSLSFRFHNGIEFVISERLSLRTLGIGDSMGKSFRERIQINNKHERRANWAAAGNMTARSQPPEVRKMPPARPLLDNAAVQLDLIWLLSDESGHSKNCGHKTWRL
jgi:hypothetical protein